MNVKQFVAIAGVVLAFMGAVCQTIGDGSDAVEKIKSIKEGAK